MTETRTLKTNPRYAFGNPDGARADLKELMDGFVGVSDDALQTALGDPAEDLTPRIIVGRLGAGKTIYLRRSFTFAERDPATFADPVRIDLPSTEDVVQVCQDQHPDSLEETWKQLWRCAI